MGLIFHSGFETGDTREWTSPSTPATASQDLTISGAYVFKMDALVANNQVVNTVAPPFDVPECWARCRFRFTTTGTPTVERNVQLFNLQTAEPTHVSGVRFKRQTDGTSKIFLVDYATLNTTGLDQVVLPDTTYLLELYGKIGASGGGAYRLNGVLKDQSSFNGGAVNIGTPRIGNASVVGSGTDTLVFYVDDVTVRDDGYPGAGIVIARQPVTGGSPTYNAWTKSTGTDAGALWDNTPFTTGDSCNSGSTTGTPAQTAVIASFSSTQTGHGSEVIAANGVVGGASVCLIAKTSSTANNRADGGVRARVGSTDIDTDVTLTTSDKLYRSTIFQPTVAQLLAMEAGAYKRASGSAGTHTVEDVWVMVDYLPGVASAFPVKRPQFFPPRRRVA